MAYNISDSVFSVDYKYLLFFWEKPRKKVISVLNVGIFHNALKLIKIINQFLFSSQLLIIKMQESIGAN